MPKEVIKDCAVDTQHLEVTWNPDRFLQLASVNSASPFEFPAKHAGGTADGQVAITQPAEPFDGWRVTLDSREKVNRLIRVLRRARDARFGADA